MGTGQRVVAVLVLGAVLWAWPGCGGPGGSTGSGGVGSGPGVDAPSCKAAGDGLTNCGANSESCCTSLEVAGGTYSRTYTNTGNGATALADPATVSGFRLDKYAVTVARFRAFVAAWSNGTGYALSMGSGKHTHLNGGQGLANTGSTAGTYEPGWMTADNSKIAPTTSNLASASVCPRSPTWTASPAGDEKLPINCVNWYEAYAFCIWDGGFLPSEAEWEYAAAGGNQHREYPWGSTAPGTENQYAIYGCNYPSSSCSSPSVADIAPVGTATMGAGLWGQLDLAGNVNQWNLDWDANYASCTDCVNLTPATYRTIRGGSFVDSTSRLQPTAHGGVAPESRSDSIGLRCARTP